MANSDESIMQETQKDDMEEEDNTSCFENETEGVEIIISSVKRK